jgi:hypothetical protein
MPYPLTLRAVAQKDGQSWEVGDALRKEIRTTASGQVASGEYTRAAAWLAEQGYERSSSWLAGMRKVAVARPTARSRRFRVGFRLYMLAVDASSDPARQDAWLAEAEASKLTLREFNVLITGRPWADTNEEKVKATARDNPETIVELLKDNPEIAAEAAKHPEVAAAIVANKESELAVMQAQGAKGRRSSGRRTEPEEPFARALTVLHLAALKHDAEAMQKVAVEQFSGSYVWRPRERERVLAELDRVTEIVANVRAVLTAEVSDAQLADFLKS